MHPYIPSIKHLTTHFLQRRGCFAFQRELDKTIPLDDVPPRASFPRQHHAAAMATPMRGLDVTTMGTAWQPGLTRAGIWSLPSLPRVLSGQTVHLVGRRFPWLFPSGDRESTTMPPLVVSPTGGRTPSLLRLPAHAAPAKSAPMSSSWWRRGERLM